MTDRKKDRKTKNRVYIFNIGIILITTIWLIGGYIDLLIYDDKMGNLSQLLQGGTMLLYTLYIPIAVSIIDGLLVQKSPLSQLNNKIFFDRIFNIKTHVKTIALTVLAVILTDTEKGILIVFGSLLWFLANSIIIKSIFEAGEYIQSNNKAQYYFDVIKDKEKFIDGMKDIFNSLNQPKQQELDGLKDSITSDYIRWGDEDEKSFINLIINKISEYRSKYQYNEVYSVFNIIYKNISKINFRYRNQDFIKALFKWRYEFFKIYIQDNQGQNTDLPIYQVIDQILLNVLQQCIKDNEPLSATIDFFNRLHQHLIGYKDSQITIKGDREPYLEWFRYFGEKVITEILDLEDVFKAGDILEYHWENQQRNWQITIENLSSDINKDSKITWYWCNIMLRYIDNIWRKDFNRLKNIDFKDIDKVNTLINVFIPDINPELFMEITELRLWGYDVRLYIESRGFIGIMTNVEVLTFDRNTSQEDQDTVWEKRNEEQKEKAINVLIKIYGLNQVFYKDMIKKITELPKYEPETPEWYRLDSLKKTIEAINKKLK
jgi:hypothetical protein